MKTENQVTNNDELFNDFIRKYHKYLSALNKLFFIKEVSTHYFKDFPNKLSDDIKDSLKFITNLFQGSIDGEFRVILNKDDELILEFKDNSEQPMLKGEIEAPIRIGSAFLFLDTKIVNEKKIAKFKDTISDELIETSNSKAFVMLFSYFDSYLQDCLYFTLKVRPEKWQEKYVKLNFIEIKNKITEDIMIKKHIEQNFSRNIYKLFESVCKILNIKKTDLFYKEQLIRLEEFIEVRNILVHNFGLVDNKFKSKVETTLEEGEKFQITNSYVNKSFDFINDAMYKIYKVLSLEIFSKDITKIAIEELKEIVKGKNTYRLIL